MADSCLVLQKPPSLILGSWGQVQTLRCDHGARLGLTDPPDPKREPLPAPLVPSTLMPQFIQLTQISCPPRGWIRLPVLCCVPLLCDTLRMSIIRVVGARLGLLGLEMCPLLTQAPSRKERRKEGQAQALTVAVGPGRASRGHALCLTAPGWGGGTAHQLVLDVPVIGVAVLIDDSLEPQRVGVAHDHLRWGQERH